VQFFLLKKAKYNMSMTSLLPLPTLRTCSRCGQEFRGASGAYTCNGCRKSKGKLKPDELRGKSLAAREKQIVGLIRQAKANKEIAYELHLAEGTVKVYISVIFKKLGIQNRTELALWAMGNQESAA
jgi:DNA-binding NarL/FixJ family response regulator